MKLRSKLLLLTMQAALPPMLLCLVVGGVLVNYERESFRRGVTDSNRAFMTAVDAEVRGHVSTLTALAASNNLEADKLPAFREEAVRVVNSQPEWHSVSLTMPSGQQLVNTIRPITEKLPIVLDLESVQRAVATRRPAAGNINIGRSTNTYVVPIRIPVLRKGEVAYVLSAVIHPAAFAKLIAVQRLPATWVIGLIDGTGRFIARVPPRSPGELASENFRATVRQSPEGWYRGLTVEGIPTYTAHKTSEFTSWSVGLAIPVEEVNAAAYRAASLVAFGALLTSGLAFWFASRTGRRIAMPITELVAAARLVGAGQAPPDLPTQSEIREVREVAEALIGAASAIHEREALIEREQSLLRAADRAKDEFLAMLGHELRNPLSAVSNAAIVLQRADLSADHRRAAQAIISRQTEQLTRLVNDLLDVGRVVAGKIRLDQAVVDLGAVTEGAVAAIKSAERADTRLISIDCAAGVNVLGDRARLEQVVTNLLTNAIAYTAATGSIDVSVFKEAGQAVLQIADNGIGIRDQDRESIFNLFYQADQGLHRKGGLGIGLTLVKRLVQMHGGMVSVTSAGLGQGATFTVRVPLLAVSSQADLFQPLAGKLAPPLQILLIDDSEDALTSMQMLLTCGGHDVEVAGDGESGLRAALRRAPDVAIIDIGMPGMDGYEVAREIRRQCGDRIFLIAMTGYGQPEDVKRALAAGFDAHQVKPVEYATLNALLAKLGSRAAAV